MANEPKEPIQIFDGSWYALASPSADIHVEECCTCALIHRVDYKVENGRIWVRWVVDEKDTKAARKRRKITREVNAVIRKEKQNVPK